jgi:site-specific DNA-methyltransferase (adenine-specific)
MSQTSLLLGLGEETQPSGNIKALEQYQTPLWAAEALTEIFLNELGRRGKKPGRVLEPSCGRGNFLKVLPADCQAYGIEIDPELAWIAQWESSREVAIGDFRTCTLPLEETHRPNHLLGNPPFSLPIVREFLARAAEVLDGEGGTCGFLLPAHSLQHPNTVVTLEKTWGITPWLIPRNIFPRISVPLIFALFELGGESRGLELHRACARIHSLPPWLRNELGGLKDSPAMAGKPRGAWHRVVTLALQGLGGKAHLSKLYQQIEPMRPTDNRHWREKVRQILQQNFQPLGEGHWACPTT